MFVEYFSFFLLESVTLTFHSYFPLSNCHLWDVALLTSKGSIEYMVCIKTYFSKYLNNKKYLSKTFLIHNLNNFKRTHTHQQIFDCWICLCWGFSLKNRVFVRMNFSWFIFRILFYFIFIFFLYSWLFFIDLFSGNNAAPTVRPRVDTYFYL